MNRRAVSGVLALSSWSLALFACAAAVPPKEPSPAPVASAPAPSGPGEATSNQAAPGAPSAGASPFERAPAACKLPAPKKSGDACQTDADCGPSAPCHAPACVAKAKSPPRPLYMMCTMSYGCDTADANRCGCYEGSCALIPPP